MTRHSQDIDRHVGLKVAQLRQTRGMSQTALADQLGVSFQQVQKYEKGANRISASRLFQMSEVFGCTVSDLFPDPAFAAVRGMQEEAAPSPAITKDGIALLSAFAEITDQNLRRALSQIAVALAKA